ncbi:MAG: hypothetical protein ACXAD7_19050 [Candidatus Kariarchaeaceae archaeon]
MKTPNDTYFDLIAEIDSKNVNRQDHAEIELRIQLNELGQNIEDIHDVEFFVKIVKGTFEKIKQNSYSNELTQVGERINDVFKFYMRGGTPDDLDVYVRATFEENGTLDEENDTGWLLVFGLNLIPSKALIFFIGLFTVYVIFIVYLAQRDNIHKLLKEYTSKVFKAENRENK